MKESYSEVRAGHADPESYAEDGNILGVATAGAHAGRDIELRKPFNSVCRRCTDCGRQHRSCVKGQAQIERGGVEDLVHVWKLQAREPGDPQGLLEEVASSGQRTPLEARLS